MVYEETVEGNTAAGAQWAVWFTGNGAPPHLSPGLALTQAQQSSQLQDGKQPQSCQELAEAPRRVPTNPSAGCTGTEPVSQAFHSSWNRELSRLLRSSETATQNDD